MNTINGLSGIKLHEDTIHLVTDKLGHKQQYDIDSSNLKNDLN